MLVAAQDKLGGAAGFGGLPGEDLRVGWWGGGHPDPPSSTLLHHYLHPALHFSVLLLPALHSAHLFILLGLTWLLWILSAENKTIFVRKTDSEYRIFRLEGSGLSTCNMPNIHTFVMLKFTKAYRSIRLRSC